METGRNGTLDLDLFRHSSEARIALIPPMSIEDRPLLWMVVRSQTHYPEHILAYGSGKACCSLIVTTRVFGEAKNMNFLKFFLQCVKHVDARSNKEQFINKLLHTYSISCRSLPEILGRVRVFVSECTDP